MSVAVSAFVLSFASLALGQYGPGGRYGPDGDNGGDYSPYSAFNGGFDVGGFSTRNKALNFCWNIADGVTSFSIAHGVLASLAFVILFPMGSILIRLGSFPGLWLVHGLFQLFAFLVYISAFGIGIWLTQQGPFDLLHFYHPIIGIVVFVLLFFQPILGLIHHFQFKKHGRRTVWSYGHLWLGRVLVTLGIINGGLGLLFAHKSGFGRPTRGQMIAYGVVAGVMWLLWVAASIIGERRRANARRVPVTVYKEQYA
ncbi:hypothetical protein N0V90_011796 [Kalmusia sp. IMI 367209]|nr:hypothetical protein N0V90_011796 [Kalmusia sp. IMI 367209]